MKAMVIKEFGQPLEYMDLPDPEPGYGEVVLTVEACGVCQSDLKVFSGLHPNCASIELPFVLGHEVVGRVESLGQGVTGWKAGDRAIVSIYMGCTTCDSCRAGMEQLCTGNSRIIGFSQNGGYAQKLRVRARNLVPVSDNISAPEAAAITDAIATSYRAAFDAAEVKCGESALIIGFGGLGVHLAQILRAGGLHVVICEPSKEKLSAAAALDLNNIFCGYVEDLPAAEKFDIIFDVTGKIYDYNILFKNMKRRGRFVMVGYSVDRDAGFLSATAHVNELRLIGTRGHSYQNLKASAAMVENGQVKPIIGGVRPLEEANEVLQMLRDGFSQCGRLVLVP